VRRADNLAHSCADCLKIWEPQPPGTLRACNGIALPLPYIHGHTNFAIMILRIVRMS
jgi:hypothetical protein